MRCARAAHVLAASLALVALSIFPRKAGGGP